MTLKRNIFRYICLVCYVFSTFLLIYEACMEGNASSEQSTAVAEAIQNVITTVTNNKVVIHDFDSFMAFIRKLVGHYGAFLILGIFSSFTYLNFFYKNKKFTYIGIGINFLQGLALAFITELIQLFTPGRYGQLKDVLIDYGGFITSAIIITAIVLLIRYKKTKTIQEN